ncbi:hypothetical protein CHELA40_15426 [Chelatococcus asaccharovorans]|nr:hypothetical protein CHELA17_60191 [Chelatococcus asaccharovorans]CAH1682479.1 hypothetical protein CHELA40_15426 [Chelatococcus asaccharovorans]
MWCRALPFTSDWLLFSTVFPRIALQALGQSARVVPVRVASSERLSEYNYSDIRFNNTTIAGNFAFTISL